MGGSSVEDWTEKLWTFLKDANSPCTHKRRRSAGPKVPAPERSVADMTFATRSTVKSPHTRSLEQIILPVKVPLTPLTRKIRIYVEDLGGQYPSSKSGRKDSLLEQKLFPKPKEIPSEGSSGERNPSRSCSNEKSCEIFAVHAGDFYKSSSCKYQWPSRWKNGNGNISLACGVTSKRSFDISSRVVIKVVDIHQHFVNQMEQFLEKLDVSMQRSRTDRQLDLR